jgi:fructokinase
VCGEALIDLVPTGTDTFQAVCGGGPANTATALARLGTPASLLCRLSADAFGRRLRANLLAHGVDLSLARTGPEPTTLAVVNLDGDGVAEYGFYGRDTADWHWHPDELPERLPADTRAVHVGSLATVMAPGAPLLRDWVATHRAATTVVYDINARPRMLPDVDEYRRNVADWLAIADCVKVSDDDLGWLHPGEQPTDIATRWFDRYAVQLVLLTRGAAGAMALHRSGVVWIEPARTVAVVDTVGAGDTFTAAFLHWLLAHGSSAFWPADLGPALRYAVTAGALACTRAGAQPPTAAEVDNALFEETATARPH